MSWAGRASGADAHTRAVLSWRTGTTRRPPGVKDAERTASGWASWGATGWTRAASNTRAVLPQLAVTTRRPSGLNDAEDTLSAWANCWVRTGTTAHRPYPPIISRASHSALSLSAAVVSGRAIHN